MAALDDVLADYFEWEQQDYCEAVEGIHRGYEDMKAGLRWSQGMQKAMASLSEMPARCALGPENKNFPYEVRQLLYGSTRRCYRILFTIEGDVVTVLHIRHGRRSPLTH